MIDTDGNGSISVTELKNLFSGVGDVSDHVWNELVKEADSDGNGEIDF